MSTFNIDPATDIKTAYSAPANTSVTDVIEAPTNRSVTVLGLLVANLNTTGTNHATIERYDGANSFYQMYQYPVPASGIVEIETPFTLGRTEKLRFTIETADEVHLTATYFEQPLALGVGGT